MRLSKLQHDRLLMDCYAEGPEGIEGTTLERGKTVGGGDGAKLRDELRLGRTITITSFVIDELREFADRDAEPGEQRMYKHLLSKALSER